jgi:cell fate regulator YaaT (PSP1 superfamily)
LNVHDWLSNLELPWGQKPFEYVEVRFKENRKEFFRNVNQLDLYQNEWVVVEAQQGHDVGQVTLKGELVRLQMKRRRVSEEDPGIKKIYRKATPQDLQKLAELREQEAEVAYKAKEIIKSTKLNMKLSDVEFQGDRAKIIFYYTAEERVDFRELIRLLADAFKARVEMRQIGPRQEAARIGGLGVCGRELCCSSWLTDFKSVSTTAARYQNLSLNPAKLAGQCGRLKCCLNYELETYMDALQAFPKDARYLNTQTASYELVKTDIFKRQMWYQIQGKAGEYTEVNAIPLSIEQVLEVRAMNKAGEKPLALEAMVQTVEVELEEEPDFELEAEGVLDRFDGSRRKKKKKKKPGASSRPTNAADAQAKAPAKPANQNQERPQGPRPERQARNEQPRNENSGNRPPQGPRPDRRPRPEGTAIPTPPKTEAGAAPENREPKDANNNRNRNNRRRFRGPRREGGNNNTPAS